MEHIIIICSKLNCFYLFSGIIMSLQNRPLTRYLPIKGEATNFDLRLFIEQGGHCLDLCQEIKVTSHCAYGFLKKIGRRLKTWRRKWFVFDRNQKQLCYYSDRSELLLKGRISFQVDSFF